MISDGKNLMLNSREVYKLRHIISELSDRKMYWFGDTEEEQILAKWVDQFQFGIAASDMEPNKSIDIANGGIEK